MRLLENLPLFLTFDVRYRWCSNRTPEIEDLAGHVGSLSDLPGQNGPGVIPVFKFDQVRRCDPYLGDIWIEKCAVLGDDRLHVSSAQRPLQPVDFSSSAERQPLNRMERFLPAQHQTHCHKCRIDPLCLGFPQSDDCGNAHRMVEQGHILSPRLLGGPLEQCFQISQDPAVGPLSQPLLPV